MFPAANPLVSVIVPAFNSERTLAETLRAVAAQTYRPIELLVVDDGSIDATRSIAQSFCDEHNFARLIVQSNRGVAAARNRAIDEARGAYIAPLDSDDIWHETYLAKLVAAMLAAPVPPAFAYAHTRAIDADSRIIASAGAYRLAGPAVYALQFCNVVGSGSGMVMDAEAVRKVGGYSEVLRAEGIGGCEDYLLQLKLATLGPIVGVGEFLVGYRVRRGSMSDDRERMLASYLRAHEVFVQECSPAPVPRRFRRWNAARNAMRRAEAARTLGRHAQAVPAYVRAMALDPVAVAHAAYSRLLTFFSKQADGAGPGFYETDPLARDALALRARHYSLHQAQRLAKIVEFERAQDQSHAAAHGVRRRI